MILKACLLILLAASLIAAIDPAGAGKSKVKTIAVGKWMDSVYYNYDPDGRLLTVTSNHRPKITFEYTGNIITEKTKHGRKLTMYLNDRGLVDSLVDVDSSRVAVTNPDGSQNISLGSERMFAYSGDQVMPVRYIAGSCRHGIISYSKKFIYDDAGFVKEEKVYINGGEQIVSLNRVQGDNIISYTIHYPKDTILVTDPITKEKQAKVFTQDDMLVINSYDPNKPNTLSYKDPYGRCSKNIILRSVMYDLQSNSDSTVTDYHYTWDPQGRISSLVTSVKSTDPPEYNQDKMMSDSCFISYY